MMKIMVLIKDLYRLRKVLYSMAVKDFTSRYIGSYFGLVWAIVTPLITILVYWFVFEKGLKATSPISHVPFVIWFITGIVPWLFFSDCWSMATGCMFEYGYLVKKVVFRVSVLPVIKIVSSCFIHIVFVLVIFGFMIAYSIKPSIYNVQFFYYSFCVIVLALGLSWITATVLPFFRDLGQIVGILLQLGMWLTPIAWPPNILPPRLEILFKLNPMYYVVQGYRDSFISHVWFYQRYNETVYFWVLSFFICMCGLIVFRKLKPHLADVL